MVLNECHRLIKYTLLFVNLIFWALGLTTVIVAVYALVDKTYFVSLVQEQNNYLSGLYITLAAGSLLMIVSFLGCCGAFRESQCMLVGFFSCLLVVMVAQIAAGAWLYTNRDSLEGLLNRSVMATIKTEYGVIESRTEIVDSFQTNFGCCGAKGPSDWAGSKYASKDSTDRLALTVGNPDTTYLIPESCCITKDMEECKRIRQPKLADIISAQIYQEGCIDKLVAVFKSFTCTILGITIAVGTLELIGLIFSLVLCCAIGSSDRYKA